MGNLEEKISKDENKEQFRETKLFKDRKIGNALLVKASHDSYERVMRTKQELKQLGVDVREVRQSSTES